MSGVTFEDIKQEQVVKQARPGPGSPSSSSTSMSTPRNLDISVLSTTTVPEYSQELVSQPLLALDHSNRLFQPKKRKVPFEDDIRLPLGRHLTDPFLQDLNQDARFYISYCKVCSATFSTHLLSCC